jgi:hypothetical protein
MTVDPVGYHSRASVSGVRWGELGLKLSLTDVALRHVRRDQTSQDTDVFNQVSNHSDSVYTEKGTGQSKRLGETLMIA